MHIAIISLFPEMFAALNYGVIGKAIKNGTVQLSHWNPRDYALDKHGYVDDRPYGGGPGMVMMVQPLRAAIHAAKSELGKTKVIHLSPQGKLLGQNELVKLAKEEKLLFVASRYEGVDERLIELEVDEEWSIGDYVLTGGELPTMVMVDALIRLIPGVLGHEDSALEDSFMRGLLDYPHYTRPEMVEEKKVPTVLLQGNHKEIALWRLKQALGRTWLRRPDLLSSHSLTASEQTLLNEFICDYLDRGKCDE